MLKSSSRVREDGPAVKVVNADNEGVAKANNEDNENEDGNNIEDDNDGRDDEDRDNEDDNNDGGRWSRSQR